MLHSIPRTGIDNYSTMPLFCQVAFSAIRSQDVRGLLDDRVALVTNRNLACVQQFVECCPHILLGFATLPDKTGKFG